MDYPIQVLWFVNEMSVLGVLDLSGTAHSSLQNNLQARIV